MFDNKLRDFFFIEAVPVICPVCSYSSKFYFFYDFPLKICFSSFKLNSYTYVRLFGCHNRRPSGSYSGDKQLLCRRTTDRFRTAPESTCHWCTSRTGHNNRDGSTSVHRAFLDIGNRIPGIGLLQ